MSSWEYYRWVSTVICLMKSLKFSSHIWHQSNHAEEGVCAACQTSARNKSPDWKGSHSLDEVKQPAGCMRTVQPTTQRLTEWLCGIKMFPVRTLKCHWCFTFTHFRTITDSILHNGFTWYFSISMFILTVTFVWLQQRTYKCLHLDLLL